MRTLREVIERNAHFYPELEAYVDRDRRVTHRRYAQRVRQLASALHARGMGRQDRVAILSMNNLEYFEIYGACEWAGFIAAGINFRLAVPEIAHVLRDSTPTIVIFEAQYLAAIETLRGQFPGIQHYLCIGPGTEWAESYENALEAGHPAGPSLQPDINDYVYLVYTSGTTGRPKGVATTHRRALQAAQSASSEMEMRTNGCTFVTTPAFHVGGKDMRGAQSWRAGKCVVLRNFDAHELLESIQRERGEVIFLVAEQLRVLLDWPGSDQFDLSSIRTINMAGAPIPVPLLKRALARFGPVIVVQYGMTEGTWTTLYKHELLPNGTPEEIKRIGSVGHAMPNVTLRVVDERGQDCPPGVPGEVWGRSESMLEIYWNNPAATLEALEGGWMHTGDVGYLDARGYLYLVDRKKDMIISGGENVYSREVEEALHAHPAVMEAAVVGMPDERWGEAVKAFVILNPGMSVPVESLIEHCRSLMARYKCPKAIEFVSQLPRLPTGKINKIDLRSRARGQQ